MNKFSALGLLVLATVAGSAHATLLSECTRTGAFNTAKSCTTPNGATTGAAIGTGLGATATKVTADLTTAHDARDSTNGQGIDSGGFTVCSAIDRDPVGGTGHAASATGCAGAITLFLSVQNRN